MLVHDRSLVHWDDAFRCRRAAAQGAVRPEGVVVAAPVFDEYLGLAERVEDLTVEEFSPEAHRHTDLPNCIRNRLSLPVQHFNLPQLRYDLFRITRGLDGVIGLPYSIHTQAWPEYDAALAAEDVLTLVVQINGKVRARITVPAGISESDAKQAALAHAAVQRQLDGKLPQQVVYVAGRLVNIVL